MSEGARVEDVELLRAMRAAMFKFADAANIALADAEAEAQQALVWLETEQRQHWQTQVRKATEAVARAADAVRMKKIYKDSSGRQSSAVDEEKALALAKRRLEEAEHKLEAVRRAIPRLKRELLLYKGQTQRLATTVQSEIPVAAASLDRMVRSLEGYTALAPSEADSPPAVAMETDEARSVAPDPAPMTPPVPPGPPGSSASQDSPK
jgi:hypothetical protein